MPYVDFPESLLHASGGRTDLALDTIAGRFIGKHPRQPVVYRVHRADGPPRGGDYRYIFKPEQIFQDLPLGSRVYAWAKMWSDAEREAAFAIACFGPVRLYVNGNEIYRSGLVEELLPEGSTVVRVPLRKGWNHFVLRFEKTAAGCGGRFGGASVKRDTFHFLAPSVEREGQEGWLLTPPLADDLNALPGEGTRERDTGVPWWPRLGWNFSERTAGRFARIFGFRPGRYACARTKLICDAVGGTEIELSGETAGRSEWYLDGQLIHRSPHDGKSRFSVRTRVAFGGHDLIIRSTCPERGEWGFSLEPPAGVRLAAPEPVLGAPDEWIYAGTFAEEMPFSFERFLRMNDVLDDGENGSYWRVDLPEAWVRVYLENPMFGRWNYPLGVTLYGLAKTGEALGCSHYVEYAASHVELCTAYAAYTHWDRRKFDAAAHNHQLTAIDSLDDCGSFGAAMLYIDGLRPLAGVDATAEQISDYILHKQARLLDGAFYRPGGTTPFMKDTLWCDDLYMSVPFLARMYARTGNPAYAEDAVRQCLLYRSYLFMEDIGLMSHVYDFKFGKATGVPWGRGNGWAVFAAAELLETIPPSFPRRDELLEFFRRLCDGVLRRQGENGLWHQVLTDPTSYEETSCTAMFVYAFAKGVRLGWFDRPEPYAAAALAGWTGILRCAADRFGRIYGICRGSGYSFSPSYYRDELTWLLDDTHGIGAVLLAGVETMKMRESLQDLSPRAILR